MFFINSAIGYHAIWSHNHEIANLLSKKGKVYWLDPIKVKGFPHFEQINKNVSLKNIKILNKDLYFKSLSPYYLIKSEIESFKHLWKLRKKVDYFVSYNITGNFLAFLLAKILRKKTISFYVDDYIELSKNKILKILLKFLLPFWFKFSDKIIVSAKILEIEAKKYNENTFYFPNGVNLEILKKYSPQKAEKLKSIGFVGALGNWVDGKIIIDLANKFKNINFEIVGDGEIFSYLKEEKKKNNLENLVLYGFKAHKEALEIIGKTDLTFIPFKVNKITDAVSPVKLFEYWSLGKTSIVSNTLELKQFDKELFIYKNKQNLFDIIEKISINSKQIYEKSLLCEKKLEGFNWGGKLGENILKVILD